MLILIFIIIIITRNFDLFILINLDFLITPNSFQAFKILLISFLNDNQ